MSTTIAPASRKDAAFDTVCEAIKDVHDEASLWRLSDELVVIAPAGVQSVENVVAQAKARDIPTKSVNTLRLYRDVAIRFPANERVAGVSFSAHREAIAIGTTAEAVQVLDDLVKQHGAAGVTVTTVKAAVQAKSGKVSAPKQSVKPQSALADVARDLSNNAGKGFISELDALTAINGITLDGLHAGVSHLLAAIESKRARAARKAAQAAKSTPKVQPAKAGPRNGKAATSGKATPVKASAGKAAAGKAGDLRDL